MISSPLDRDSKGTDRRGMTNNSLKEVYNASLLPDQRETPNEIVKHMMLDSANVHAC